MEPDERFGETPLASAVRSGNAAVAALLLDAGANAARAPCVAAAITRDYGSAALLRLLAERGAPLRGDELHRLSECAAFMDNGRWSAADVEAMVAALVTRGARVNRIGAVQQLSDHIVSRGLPAIACSALHVCAARRYEEDVVMLSSAPSAHLALVRALLAGGADANVRDAGGETPLARLAEVQAAHAASAHRSPLHEQHGAWRALGARCAGVAALLEAAGGVRV